MELREIARILLRRWWLVLIPPLIVAALAARNWRSLVSPPVSYGTAVRFTVGQPPIQPAQGFDPRYYGWLTSEYVANGLEEWVRGRRYAELVSADLAARGQEVPPERIQGAVVSDSSRSVLVLYLTWPDAAELAEVARSAVRILSDFNAEAFPQLGPGGAVVTPLDAIAIGANVPGLREQLDLPLRLGLAVLAGLGLAFAVDYLDPALRRRRELEQLGLSVLAEIPRRRKN
jgi:hypothetical protein